jgi:hypothetical protein
VLTALSHGTHVLPRSRRVVSVTAFLNSMGIAGGPSAAPLFAPGNAGSASTAPFNTAAASTAGAAAAGVAAASPMATTAVNNSSALAAAASGTAQQQQQQPPSSSPAASGAVAASSSSNNSVGGGGAATDVSLFIDSKALLFVVGTTMDFVDNELGSEFVFNNPNSKGSCGCGESFTV